MSPPSCSSWRSKSVSFRLVSARRIVDVILVLLSSSGVFLRRISRVLGRLPFVFSSESPLRPISVPSMDIPARHCFGAAGFYARRFHLPCCGLRRLFRGGALRWRLLRCGHLLSPSSPSVRIFATSDFSAEIGPEDGGTAWRRKRFLFLLVFGRLYRIG